MAKKYRREEGRGEGAKGTKKIKKQAEELWYERSNSR
jgi:hypothetical protein